MTQIVDFIGLHVVQKHVEQNICVTVQQANPLSNSPVCL